MMTRMMRGRAACVGFLLLVLSPSCGNDQGSTPSELVGASLLRASDLPGSEDWRIDDSTDPETKQMDKKLEECDRRTNPVATIGRGEKDSHTFSRGDLESAQSTGDVVRSKAKRDAFFNSLGDQLTCAGSVLSAFLQAHLRPGQSVEVGAPYRLDVETTAERTSGWSIQLGIAATRNSKHQTLYVDFIVVEEGELLAGYFFFHAGDLTLEQEAAVVGRSLTRVKKEQP